jgi:uncharacterized membrane protein YeiH
MSPLFFFDLLGTFAFAAYGAYLGQRKRFDLFGIFVCACVSALGGGTLRELLLHELPVYFHDPLYFITILIGTIFSILLFKRFGKIQRFMLSIDALGLVTFAFLGATKAVEAGLGLVGILIFATISAVGGGVFCDLLVREIPRIFYRDFYATPSLFVGVGVFLLQPQLGNPLIVYSLLFVVFCIRVLAIKYRIELWKPVVDISSTEM